MIQFTSQYKLILITHPIEISTSRECRTQELITDLQIVQPLSLQFCTNIILIVITSRLLMGDGIRSIYFMMRRNVVIQTKLRIEEVKVVVDHIFAVRISPLPSAWILHLIADMTILQVEEAIQSLHEFIVHLAIDVPISLLGIVTIILVVRLQVEPLWHMLHPFHQAEVITIILVPSSTYYCLDIIPIVIDQRGHNGKEVVIHLLLTDQIAFQYRITTCFRIKPRAIREILNQLATCLIFLVIAFTLGIVTSHIQIQMA